MWRKRQILKRNFSFFHFITAKPQEREKKMDCGCRVKDFEITISLPPISPLKNVSDDSVIKKNLTQFSSVQFTFYLSVTEPYKLYLDPRVCF